MALDIFQAVILAMIQGLTEWLPVSSSAHLAIAQILMKVKVPIIFDILLHIGTLIAVVVYFRKTIFEMVKSILKFDKEDENFKMASFVILASIPTAIIGFTFRGFFESSFSSPFSIGIALILTGTFFMVCEKIKGSAKISAKHAFLIGIAQGIAIMPGISRSGSTIGTALFLGVEREKATRFSFLLSIPAILGAAFFEGKDASFAGLDVGIVAVSIAVSGIVGYLSIGFMMKYVKRKGLAAFAKYCWIFGIFCLLLPYIK
ncbi:undecaprenyl-diphosphate phosphatase [Candidatus Micrarchaeota archaeon]|nr:undecaprenyl-diphosphate phosphatase [Candidatus Micrarchaeota archaeon]